MEERKDEVCVYECTLVKVRKREKMGEVER